MTHRNTKGQFACKAEPLGPYEIETDLSLGVAWVNDCKVVACLSG